MIRTQISVELEVYRRARAEAARRGISFAELVRCALAQVLADRDGDSPWMRFAGSVDLSDPDASRTIDQIVYGRERP